MMDEVSFIKDASNMLEEDFDIPKKDAENMAKLAVKLYKENL